MSAGSSGNGAESSAGAWERSAEIVRIGLARFSVLAPGLIRLEYAADKVFEDRPSLQVQNRQVDLVPFECGLEADCFFIRTALLELKYLPKGGSFAATNLSISHRGEGPGFNWRPGLEDPDNLGGTIRTLDCCDGDRFIPGRDGHLEEYKLSLGQGLLSRSGWSLVDDSQGLILSDGSGPSWIAARPEGDRIDWYFLGYGRDYRAALRAAAQVFGQQPLPPRFVFGYWYCRYWAYTEADYREIVQEADRFGTPLSVLVLDMDWHRQGWTGLSWEHSYFPDPAAFLRWLESRGIQAALNLHPAEGFGPHEDCYEAVAARLGYDSEAKETVPFECSDPEGMQSYFDLALRPLERQGVRFWWLDWQQGDKCALPGLDPLPWLNYLHWEDQREHYPERRPLCFSRYGGLGSGRTPVGFSGDTQVSWASLAWQPHFTATAANVLYGYWSHDIGGHYLGELDGELYTRWLQFGVFSPVLRTHGSKLYGTGDRRIWNFPSPYRELMRAAVVKRYELIPYIYSECRRCFDTAISLCRPLYINWPTAEESYQCSQQCQFGEEMIIAPITQPLEDDDCAPQRFWLPEGIWFDSAWGDLLPGAAWYGRRYALAETPCFVRAGALIPGAKDRSGYYQGSYEKLLLTAYPGGTGSYQLYEDDGESEEYRSGGGTWIELEQQWTGAVRRITLSGRGGDFPWFVDSRSLELRLPAAIPPERVLVQGREVNWQSEPVQCGWAYDGTEAAVIVRVPDFSVRAGLTIELQYPCDEAGAAAQGLKGTLQRLQLAFASARILEAQWERDLARLAQVGERIARQPQNFRLELKSLDDGLAEMLQNFSRISAAVTATPRFKKERFPALLKAWRLLKQAALVRKGGSAAGS